MICDLTCDVIHTCCSLLDQTCPCCLKKLGLTSSSMKSLYSGILFLDMSSSFSTPARTCCRHTWTHITQTLLSTHIFINCWPSRATFSGAYFWLRSSRSPGQPRCVFQLSAQKLPSCTTFGRAPLSVSPKNAQLLWVHVQTTSCVLKLFCIGY